MTLALTPDPIQAAPPPARAQLAHAFRAVGLAAGDVVWVQVCDEPLQGVLGSDPRAACDAILGALREVIGPQGTVLAPTFTFSFCRGAAYDPARSETVRGPWNTFTAFPEYLRALPGAVRSLDPIFSVAAEGPRAAELLGGLPPLCLGAGCVHERLRHAEAKLCLVGIGLHEAI